MSRWNQVLRRHDVLRTVFVHEKVARPLQMVLREASMGLYVEDLSEVAGRGARAPRRGVSPRRPRARLQSHQGSAHARRGLPPGRRRVRDPLELPSHHPRRLERRPADGRLARALRRGTREGAVRARPRRFRTAATSRSSNSIDRQASARYWRERARRVHRRRDHPLVSTSGVATCTGQRSPRESGRVRVRRGRDARV